MSGQNLTEGATQALIIDDTKYNAYPGIALLPNGHLICVFQSGTDDNTTHDSIIKSLVSTNGGSTWGGGQTVHTPGASIEAKNPEIALLANGTLLCTYFEVDRSGTPAWSVHCRIGTPSGDSVSWGSAILVSNDLATGGGPACAGKPLQLANGKILHFIYGWDTGQTHNSCFVKSSTDNGSTWGSLTSVLHSDNVEAYSEADAVQISGGTVVALVRHEGSGYEKLTSTDNGASWSAASHVVSTTTPGRPAILKLGSGAIMLFTRMSGSTGKWATSWDNGATWTSFSNYTASLFVYASMVLLPNGNVAAAAAIDDGSSTNADVWFQDFTGDDPSTNMMGQGCL